MRLHTVPLFCKVYCDYSDIILVVSCYMDLTISDIHTKSLLQLNKTEDSCQSDLPQHRVYDAPLKVEPDAGNYVH